MIPYGKQTIDDEDITAVVSVLKSDWLTTGPAVVQFEKDLQEQTGTDHAIAVSSGTAALHAIMFALNIGAGDEVIVPAITFVATANAVLYQGGTPVFADVNPNTLLIDPADVESKITDKTKAIITVDYAGQPCDYDALRKIADQHKLALVADACHSIGGIYQGRPIGSLADMTAFSFHPVKPLTTGEGGAVTTNNKQLATSLRHFRNHGITTDFRERETRGSWEYDMVNLGYNYRITDIQCALGSSQLKKLNKWVERRNEIAQHYDNAFRDQSDYFIPLSRAAYSHTNAFHLYVIRLLPPLDQNEIFQAMRARDIGVNVHYKPVYRHSYYQDKLGYSKGLCPNAEAAHKQILSLPIYPAMTNTQVDIVIKALSNNISNNNQACP